MAATYGFRPEYQSLLSASRPGSSTLSQPSDFIHTEFNFEPYIKAQLSLKLDNDAQLCPDFLATRSCPRSTACPRRHVSPSPLNFLAPNSHLLRDPNKRTVCKHWLRGLCKKGEQCDYLHEYDLRRIPECRFFATFGFCNSGDDCLYLHVDRKIKRRECQRYNRGFCPRGPDCPKKHVRRVACPWYLCGFCPLGPSCKMGHIKSTPPSAASRSSSPIQTHRPLTAAEAFGGGDRLGARDDGGFDGPPGRRPRYGADAGASGPGGGGPPGSRSDQMGPRGGRPSGGGGGGGGGGGWKKDLSEVLCFKCGEYGHFANTCPNPNRPGNRGGLERTTGGRERSTGGRGGAGGGRPGPY
ncbi:uncharacterized protein PFL1_05290 [Pseudozyma flocculosa PF-1]|uniref:mRNA 3'-end-processing protein n=2 Tax=Pseudozyma flocculosa TaxID=84751 RepID=A0A5C3FC70_9BASI|nr:uncharacterized protein PFL1_05290 [Pseudozyma flocculosa PF-1]EPQ27006.1 hypothetical protein PFL1_05290 [Pseudozyma flocculosa PF-1]SPO42002.1 related to mRNA 3'-end-processing protein YTH1 [Pseudozyma flocculosa]